MNKLLLEGLIGRPLTEKAPAASDAAKAANTACNAGPEIFRNGFE